MHQRRRPRALTLTLPNSEQPCLLFGDQKYTLRNFNDEGLGLWLPQPLPYNLHAGLQISGDVVVGNQIFPTKLEVRHVSRTIAGLKFILIPPELKALFSQMIEPSTYATQLKLSEESTLEDPELGYPKLWYSGPGKSELVVWFNSYQRLIQAIQVCWLGRWIFRAQFQLIQSGMLVENFEPSGGIVKKGCLLHQDSEPSRELLAKTAQFLTAVPEPLPGHLFWQFFELGEQVYLPEELVTKVKVA